MKKYPSGIEYFIVPDKYAYSGFSIGLDKNDCIEIKEVRHLCGHWWVTVVPEDVTEKIQQVTMLQRDLRMEEYLPQCSLCYTNLTKKERDAGMANCDSCQAEVEAKAKVDRLSGSIDRANGKYK